MLKHKEISIYKSLLPYCNVPRRQIDEGIKFYGNLPTDLINTSAFLYGPAGVGKTVLATVLLLDSLSKDRHVAYLLQKLDPTNAKYDPDCARTIDHLFVGVSNLLSQLKNTYNTKAGNTKEESEREIIEKYSNVNFLVLDDFGTERSTEWTFSILYLIIDNRYNNYKRTIITSNYTLNQIARKLEDDRIPSRIQAMCQIRKMSGADKRLKCSKTPIFDS